MPVSVKVSDEVYAKLKWIRNRYQTVEGKDLSWDDFFNKVLEDTLIPLAMKLQKKNPSMELNSLLSFLMGSYLSIPEILDDSYKTIWEKMPENLEMR